ncbi:tyrosine-protein kinase STYK1-like [Heterodontus francisci]|uniref:tyrosine-protein kinase STYK1-like n=1 Tax=Heterodontus francisci TaxID=7792 RepID=UPI00355C02CB
MATPEVRHLSRSVLECAEGDELCVVRRHELEVIIVPVLLLAVTCLVGACIGYMVCRRKREDESSPLRASLQRRRSDRLNSRHDIALTVASLDGSHWGAGTDLSRWQIPRDRIRGGLRAIAQGTFGTIYQASLASEEPGKERTVVLKELHELAEPVRATEFLDRIKFHACLGKHRNVPEMLGCCTERSPFYLIMENLTRGDLLNFLWMCRKDVINLGEAPYDLTERQVYNIAQQVATGLSFLHNKGLTHGEVAARSVLLQDDFTAKLGSLQIPFEIQRSGDQKAHTSVPVKWQSPERIMKKGLTPKADVWSFGVLLFELITLGAPPYASLSPNSVLQYLQRGQRMSQPATCKAPLYNLMKLCWQWKESSRPDMADVRKRLLSNLKGTSDRVVLRVPNQIDPEGYAIAAGTRVSDRPGVYTIL